MAMMKLSNTEWFGNIPTEWDVAQIGNYYELRNEKVSDYDFEPLSVTRKGIVPQLATAAKSDDHSNRKLVKKGDFVINSRSDRRGSCGISPLDGSVSLINTVMEPRGEMNPQYYNWLFHTEQFADEFYKWGHGIVDDLWTTRWQEMKKILIVAPSPDEQQVIADYLDETCSKIDEIIAEAKASIDEYKKLRNSVITNKVLYGIRYCKNWKDTDNLLIGKIPSHWRVCKVKNIASYVSDGAHVSPETDNGVYDFISTVNLKEGKIQFDNCLKTSASSFKQLVKNGCRPHMYDVLISKDGTVGKTTVIDYEKDFVVASSLVIIRPRLNLINPFYLEYNLQSHFVQEILQISMKGAGLKRVSVGKNAMLPIVLPPLEEQQEIVAWLDKYLPKYDSLIAEKESLINDLEAYKKSLIYEVVTGKRRVV